MREIPRVYITQNDKRINLEYIQKFFGTPVILTRYEFNPGLNASNNRDVLMDISHNMRDYRPGVDWILPVGSPVLIGLTFMEAGKKSEESGQINILHWSNQSQSYRELHIDTDQPDRIQTKWEPDHTSPR